MVNTCEKRAFGDAKATEFAKRHEWSRLTVGILVHLGTVLLCVCILRPGSVLRYNYTGTGAGAGTAVYAGTGTGAGTGTASTGEPITPISHLSHLRHLTHRRLFEWHTPSTADARTEFTIMDCEFAGHPICCGLLPKHSHEGKTLPSSRTPIQPTQTIQPMSPVTPTHEHEACTSVTFTRSYVPSAYEVGI
jgi:hypothetical protein